MFTYTYPKIAPPLRILGQLVVCRQPVGCNYCLLIRSSSLRSIAFGNQQCYQQLPLPVFLAEETKDDQERVAILKMKVEKAQQPSDRTLYDRSARGIERMDSAGNLLCIKCMMFKTANAFSIRSDSRYGHRSKCKICRKEEELYYRTHTLRGVMTTFVNSARSSATRRSLIPGRSEAGRYAIDLAFLLSLWVRQKGRCAYSDVVMNIEPRTSWKMSLERCDNKLGYVPGNVVFICAEFNTPDFSVNKEYEVSGSSKWSREKVHSVPELYVSSVPINDTELDKVAKSIEIVRKGRGNTRRLMSSSGDIPCSSCKLFKPLDDFYKHNHCSFGRMHICKLCQRSQIKKYRDSPAGFLKKKILSAKHTAQLRTEKGREHAGVFDLTINDIVSLYKSQRGLCHYSGIKMTLKPCSTWMCSIERLDNKKGYVSSNVALICFEFQTSDASVRTKAPVAGSAQWSKEKCSMLVEWLKSKKPTLSAE